MKVVSYYTKGPYEEVAKTYLIPSLEKWNITSNIEVIDSLGSWKSNTEYKPRFLLKELEYEDEILWTDVDSEFLQYPILFSEIPADIDIACHYLSWRLQYGYDDDKKELLSGTLLLRKSAIPLINKWIELIPNFRWEQQALEEAIKQIKPKVCELPVEYCTVVDRFYKVPDYVKNPVVVHHQASRRLKRYVK